MWSNQILVIMVIPFRSLALLLAALTFAPLSAPAGGRGHHHRAAGLRGPTQPTLAAGNRDWFKGIGHDEQNDFFTSKKTVTTTGGPFINAYSDGTIKPSKASWFGHRSH